LRVFADTKEDALKKAADAASTQLFGTTIYSAGFEVCEYQA
jgi:hypothetical protein